MAKTAEATHDLYAVILENKHGGQHMNSFLERESAEKEAEQAVKMAEESGWEGVIYFATLDYNLRGNRIVSDQIIGEDAKMLYDGATRE